MLNAKGMDISVEGQVDKLLLEPFYSRDNWSDAMLRAEIDGHFTGNSIDDLVGLLQLKMHLCLMRILYIILDQFM